MAMIEVVKYNGGPDVFAWKYPNEELGTWTQLIVNESQEAILFKGGKALDCFGSGKHTLSTENIPILNKLINLPFGGKSPFRAEVWYINKQVSLDIKWGTTSPIQLQDPKYKVFISVRSYGQFGIRIKDSRKFLTKLVGTLPYFDKDSILKFFRGLYLTSVKDTISSYLIEKQISILDINAYLEELSAFLKERMEPDLKEYGIQLLNFYVNDINIPEEDEAVKQLKAALAKRAEMDIVGYNYQQERSFDTLEGAATNPGSMQSAMLGSGIGLGMGLSMGGTMGQQFSGMTQILDTKQTKVCPSCGKEMEESMRFCPVCGIDTAEKNKEKNTAHCCSSCGETMIPGAKFCPSCGRKYDLCPVCGADMKDGENTCISCGNARAKTCPSCGCSVKAEAKFCPECGTSLVKKCPKCGSECGQDIKFCPECGEKLA